MVPLYQFVFVEVATMSKLVLTLALVAGVLFEYSKADKPEPCCEQPKCPDNEEFDICDSPCPARTCGFDPTLVKCMRPPQPGDDACVVGCRCKDGFLRTEEGVCVPANECPKQCNQNEYWDTCPSCTPETCSSLGQKPRAIACAAVCIPACRCIKGYMRDNDGDCIPKEYCSKCPGKHEYWSCGPVCDNRCDSIYGQDNCNIQNIRCNEKCYCKKGYARATNGTCIPKEDCIYECPKNEEYNKCPDAVCAPKKCSDAGFPLNCTSDAYGDKPCPGKPGCICKHGYLRNCKGVCVPTTDCPSCGGDKNATSGCGTNCGRRCSNYKRENVSCVAMCYLNGCECRPDHVYDDNTHKCVLPCDCTPVCEENEVLSLCANGICRKTCKDLNEPNVCEIPDKCKVGCICADGFLRNLLGKCVPEEECAKCPGEHEFWNCGPACDNRCDSIYDQENCNIKNKKCNEMCYCEKGYARSTNGTCIPKEDCIYECPKNEEYHDCPDAVCAPKKCSDAGFPLNCTSDVYGENPCPGKPGCICKHGYLRDCKGVCIPVTDCPSCGGDENATPGCGTNCGRHCSNYKQKNVSCMAMCYPNGCECRPDYVYDDNLDKCVLPCNCTPVCKNNEEYSKCANGVCKQSCKDLNKPDSCPRPKCCKDGCICVKGYLRDNKGNCIPIKKCPTSKC